MDVGEEATETKYQVFFGGNTLMSLDLSCSSQPGCCIA